MEKKDIIFLIAGIGVGSLIGYKIARNKTEDEITEEIYALAHKRVEAFYRREKDEEETSEN